MQQNASLKSDYKKPSCRLARQIPSSYLVGCSQTQHGEFDLAVRQLPPLLNNRHVTTLRKLTEDFASLNASRFDQQPERVSHKSVIRFTPVGHTFCEFARLMAHVTTPNETTA